MCWFGENNLQLNLRKMEEMVVDFRKNKPPPFHVCIDGTDVEIFHTYTHLEVHLDNKLEWSTDTEIVYKEGLSSTSSGG